MMPTLPADELVAQTLIDQYDEERPSRVLSAGLDRVLVAVCFRCRCSCCGRCSRRCSAATSTT